MTEGCYRQIYRRWGQGCFYIKELSHPKASRSLLRKYGCKPWGATEGWKHQRLGHICILVRQGSVVVGVSWDSDVAQKVDI